MGLKNSFGQRVTPEKSAEIATLIRAWGDDDQAALDRLTPLEYDDLLRVARRYIRNQRQGITLQPTALVHEAYLRLMDAKSTVWRDRAHFFAASAQIMRRILVDGARARATHKRGGGAAHMNHSTAVNLDQIPALFGSERSAELLALDDALIRLAQKDRRKGKVIELRFLGASASKKPQMC